MVLENPPNFPSLSCLALTLDVGSHGSPDYRNYHFQGPKALEEARRRIRALAPCDVYLWTPQGPQYLGHMTAGNLFRTFFLPPWPQKGGSTTFLPNLRGFQVTPRGHRKWWCRKKLPRNSFVPKKRTPQGTENSPP
jgi:hypothetical protein